MRGCGDGGMGGAMRWVERRGGGGGGGPGGGWGGGRGRARRGSCGTRGR